ncbi:MAG TPA: hypothetical protein VHK22_05145 [Gaiellaceae bacterium]|nr:hypothetical protein [Gaiellaceae bacterium]
MMETAESERREPPLGAYGLRVYGVTASDLLVEAETAWPSLELSNEVGPSEDVAEEVGHAHATMRLRSGGKIEVRRAHSAAAARFVTPQPLTDEELVHPYLAPVAGVMAHWFGRESFHAGGFAVDGDVWGVIGDRFAGKSSTLAWLALRGHAIVADDLLVVDPDTGGVFGGPRSVDLRADARERLGAGLSIGLAGARERWRLRLAPLPSGLRLRGWIFLEWGEETELRSIGGAERLRLLAGQRGLRVAPRNPGVFLELASLPCWKLRRPQDWSSLEPAAGRLLAAIS